ncbi:MAG: rhomboid family intramembrane serine protease [Aquabacterium sp.]|nr:rhomboid family intramembrane serine protease [Aquabacterium sp.]
MWAQAGTLHPDAGWHQPAWVFWTSAWLHGSSAHLSRNLMALALLAVLGASARMPPRAALAWLLAWPLTQMGMLQQALHTYIGLSGVLHAGFTVVALHHLTHPIQMDRHQRILGLILLAGLIFKILMENPWQHTLIRPAGSDINVAPWAHLSGAAAGAVVYLFTSVTTRALSVKRLTRKQRTLN